MCFGHLIRIVALLAVLVIPSLSADAQSGDSPGFRKYRDHVERSFLRATDQADSARQQHRLARGLRAQSRRISPQPPRVSDFSEMVSHPHRRDFVLVRFTSETTSPDRLTSLGFRHDRELKHVPGLHRLRVPMGFTMEHTLERLNALPEVAYAEPDYEIKGASVPNDPRFDGPSAWWLHQIRAYAGWDVSTDARAIGPIAVFENAIDISHEDIVDNLWINRGEIAANGLDDDGNGYIDDIHGLDLVGHRSFSHGTAVAGTLCATGNNNLGVTGIAWKCNLMSLTTYFESQTLSATVEGLEYAISMGSRISNHSAVLQTYSQALADAVDNAQAAGHLMICAAGNSDQDIEVNPWYPAALPNDNIISVSATKASEERADYSNYGPVSVDIAAPGEFITTYADNSYYPSVGTSQATPLVTGAIALAWSQVPQMTYAEIRDHVFEHARPSSHWTNLVSTGGILDVQAMMENLNPDSDGDGVNNDIDTDDDNDGIPDVYDAFPRNANESVDTDGDGVGNNADLDDDNDNVVDDHDWAPLDSSEQFDIDGDGIGNRVDSDDDCDGIADSADVDSDNDGIPDEVEGALTLDERIESILSNSLSEFATASAGDWVSVSRSEYIRLQNELNGMARFGTPESRMNTDPGSLSDWGGDMYTFGLGEHPTPANVHIAGFMRPTGQAVTGGNDFVRLSNSPYGVRFLTTGAALPDGLIDEGAEYFVQKSADQVSYSLPQYLGLTTDQTSQIDAMGGELYFEYGSVSGLKETYYGATSAGLAMEIATHQSEIDFDSDGLPDRFDIDSDNDGIADIIEAGGIDSNGDGLVDEATSQGSIASPVDSDADGLPDFNDRESSNPANDGTAYDISNTANDVFDSNSDGQISIEDMNGGEDADADGVDDLVDPDPTQFGLGTGGASGLPKIHISDVRVREDAGSAQVALTLSHASNATVAVTAFTRQVSGSAQRGQDFYGRTVALSFSPGQTSKTIDIEVINDTVAEETERLEIRLEGPFGGVLVKDVVTVTIEDDDAGTVAPLLSVVDQTFNEDIGSAGIQVTLSAPSSSAIEVTAFTRAVGNADAGSDFYGTSQKLIFAPGETRKTLNVTILDDAEIEQTETFDIRLINATVANPGQDQATIRLLDNDAPIQSPVLSVSPQAFFEGEPTAEVTVTLSPATSKPVTVTAFTQMNGTATAGQDLYGTTGDLVFAPGETTKSLSITLLNDSTSEETETFDVRLGNVTGANLENSRATMRLIDDDSPPVIVLTNDSARVTEGDGTATITLSISESADVEVTAFTRSGTAVGKGSDYFGLVKTIKFVAGGPVSQTIVLRINDDSIPESSEYFDLRFKDPRGARLEYQLGRITIYDDD